MESPTVNQPGAPTPPPPPSSPLSLSLSFSPFLFVCSMHPTSLLMRALMQNALPPPILYPRLVLRTSSKRRRIRRRGAPIDVILWIEGFAFLCFFLIIWSVMVEPPDSRSLMHSSGGLSDWPCSANMAGAEAIGHRVGHSLDSRFISEDLMEVESFCQQVSEQWGRIGDSELFSDSNLVASRPSLSSASSELAAALGVGTEPLQSFPASPVHISQQQTQLLQQQQNGFSLPSVSLNSPPRYGRSPETTSSQWGFIQELLGISASSVLENLGGSTISEASVVTAEVQDSSLKHSQKPLSSEEVDLYASSEPEKNASRRIATKASMAQPLAPIDFNKGIADVHITNLVENFVHEGTQRKVKKHAASKRSEISSNVETKTDIVVPFLKERMVQALKLIKLSRRSFLLQVWMPVVQGNKFLLTTREQPYMLENGNDSLCLYHDLSSRFVFPTEQDSQAFPGLPGRVFQKKMPEWTPNVQYYYSHEFLRVNQAVRCDVRGTVAVPVIEPKSNACLAVVELVTKAEKIAYGPEIDIICRALQVFLLGKPLSHKHIFVISILRCFKFD
ncbi:hypothetical protein O6H91_Y373600 [Diphasiastrum complanatum]|nr:hypothetical protein O6H91_Y373600 [Diphasiastrum complanatum]